jgi:hypothetical protein
MKSPSNPSSLWSAWFAMALMAVLVRAVIPTGYMIAPEQGLNLVICTGHGPAVSRADDETPSKAPQKQDQPCAFAGFHATATIFAVAFTAAPMVWSHASPRLNSLDLAPGRGLAAPPPPSHAPPTGLV